MLASYSRACSVLITVRFGVLPACRGLRGVTDVAWSQLHGFLSVCHEQIPLRGMSECNVMRQRTVKAHYFCTLCHAVHIKDAEISIYSVTNTLPCLLRKHRTEHEGRWAMEKRVSLGIGQGESRSCNAHQSEPHLPGMLTCPDPPQPLRLCPSPRLLCRNELGSSPALARCR